MLTKLRVACGFASLQDVETGRLEDRMDSFFLTETLKYLYLLFDTNNFINTGNYIFTTEAHIFPMFVTKLCFLHAQEYDLAQKTPPGPSWFTL